MRRIHKKTYFFNALQSTQDTALEVLQNTPEPAILVIARYQHHGRGQRENTWHSPSNASVLCTLGLKGPVLNRIPAEHLYWTLSVLTQQYVIKRFTSCTMPICIKWPNDLYINNKKLGGILIELSWQGTILQHARIGLGLNIKGDFSALHNPLAQLSDYCSISITPKEIAEEWADYILQELCFPSLHTDELKSLYENALMGKNTWQAYHVNAVHKTLQITGIDDLGNLIMKTTSNELIKPLHHQLQWTWLEGSM